jgi:hypothetical protein
MPRIGAPKTTPVHGKSLWSDGFHIEKKSGGTLARSPDHPPTALRPMNISVIEPTISTTACITSV